MGGGAVQSIEAEKLLPEINDSTETFLNLIHCIGLSCRTS